MKTQAYQPIDCNYYDELEAFAVKNAVIKIEYFNESEQRVTIQAVIKDFFIEDKIEYMFLDSGEKIRLDCISHVGGKYLLDHGKVCNTTCTI